MSYEDRKSTDITEWIEYFIAGMAFSCEAIAKQITKNKTKKLPDHTEIINGLKPSQRKALKLFQKNNTVTSAQIGKLFNFKPSTSAKLCQEWVKEEFLEIENSSNRGRTYKLAERYRILIQK